MPRRPITAVSMAVVAALTVSNCGAFHFPLGHARGASKALRRPSMPSRRQDVSCGASPMEKFMNGLADMMGGQSADEDTAESLQSLSQERGPRDVNEFRRDLIRQARFDTVKKAVGFSGYDMYDLIVDKFGVPYDVQINKTVFAGKPVLCFNVMWKYLGQSSFHLTEMEYLEHLEALAQLLQEWDRVDHFLNVLAETKKRPNPYFGYAVALPLDLDPDTLAGYFNDSYF